MILSNLARKMDAEDPVFISYTAKRRHRYKTAASLGRIRHGIKSPSSYIKQSIAINGAGCAYRIDRSINGYLFLPFPIFRLSVSAH